MIDARDTATWWCAPAVIHDLHDGSCLAHDLVRDRIRRLSTDAAMCLAAAQRVKSGTPDTLARRLLLAARVFGGIFKGNALPSLFDDEWILTRQAWLDRLQRGPADQGASIACVAIVTKERLPLLRRGLTSVLINRRRWGRTYRVAVFDNSANPTCRAETREAVARLAREYSAPILYADLDVRNRWVSALVVRTGIDRRVLEFGFLPNADGEPSYGANLNSFLLHVTGELALCLDDDVVYGLATASDAQVDAVEFGQDGDPTHFRFYGTRQQAFDDVSGHQGDVAGAHERTLGKSLGTVAASHAVTHVNPRLSEKLMRSVLLGHGRVAVTWTGLAGDNGMGVPHDLLLLKDACLHDLSRVMEHTNEAVTRNVVRTTRATAITSGGTFMNPLFGVDHRTPLPPFIPRFRNCDGLFGVCVPLCLPHGYFAHLPHVVVHDPTDDRHWDRADLWRHAGTFRVADFLLMAVQGTAQTLGTTDDVEQRLVSLGLYCEMLGKQPLPIFREFMRSQFVQVQHRRLATLTQRLDAASTHRTWAADIRRQIETITQALSGDVVAPADLEARAGSAEAALRQLQRIVLQFGELLGAWPVIHREARSIPAA